MSASDREPATSVIAAPPELGRALLRKTPSALAITLRAARDAGRGLDAEIGIAVAGGAAWLGERPSLRPMVRSGCVSAGGGGVGDGEGGEVLAERPYSLSDSPAATPCMISFLRLPARKNTSCNLGYSCWNGGDRWRALGQGVRRGRRGSSARPGGTSAARHRGGGDKPEGDERSAGRPGDAPGRRRARGSRAAHLV